MVFRDALRISLPATIGALLVGVLSLVGLSWIGALTVFGVRISPETPILVTGGVAIGAFTLAVGSALAVAWRYSSVDPSRLLEGNQ
jgi:ABC-type antimicrobial peptide transport system permease subunit